MQPAAGLQIATKQVDAGSCADTSCGVFVDARNVLSFCMLFTEVPNLSRVQWVNDPATNQLAPVLDAPPGPM